MGAWEAGSFDNDDTSDWIDEFSEEPTRKIIERTLETVTDIGDEYLEATESSMAIAAAEVVAALQNAPHSKLLEELREVLGNSKIASDRNLVDLALKAVERVKTNSELKELWEEGDASEWLAAIDDLEARLRR